MQSTGNEKTLTGNIIILGLRIHYERGFFFFIENAITGF